MEEMNVIDPGLEGKVVLITGANNPFGIGAAIARAFVVQRARVFLTYLREPPEIYGVSQEEATQAATPSEAFGRYQNTRGADSIVREIRESGGEVEALELDLVQTDRIPGLFDAVEEAFGQVDVLVNNAAHCMYPDNVLDTTAERIDNHFAVNTRAIVLTRAAAHELGPYGVTVNIVSPGPVQTGYYDEAIVRREEGRIPLQRIGRPEDIANAVLFFASDQASWITGQRIYVGGGHNM
jgi:3-oxoacyl-[acyl-carrier protein] reductase